MRCNRCSYRERCNVCGVYQVSPAKKVCIKVRSVCRSEQTPMHKLQCTLKLCAELAAPCTTSNGTAGSNGDVKRSQPLETIELQRSDGSSPALSVRSVCSGSALPFCVTLSLSARPLSRAHLNGCTAHLQSCIFHMHMSTVS